MRFTRKKSGHSSMYVTAPPQHSPKNDAILGAPLPRVQFKSVQCKMNQHFYKLQVLTVLIFYRFEFLSLQKSLGKRLCLLFLLLFLRFFTKVSFLCISNKYKQRSLQQYFLHTLCYKMLSVYFTITNYLEFFTTFNIS